MAHIQRLSIQGIRSFDPERPQEIKFFPLTIIVGPNGAGKTTIIESLKYATTGIMPPNSNLGKTFIHDIQLTEQKVVYGQIRLVFKDVEKKLTTVTRSIQASLKNQRNSKPQIAFRQMNSVILRDGKAIDQKLADINFEVLDLIGVSKAILNNVIFCHQEELNWPLSEGKVLKEKFDDIFGSIAYVKLLEKIKKTREEEMIKHRLLEKDVTFASHIKAEADNKRKNLMQEKAKTDLEKEKVKTLQEKLSHTKERIDELIDKESSIEELVNEKFQIEGSIAEKKKLVMEIEKRCSSSILALAKNDVKRELENLNENDLKVQRELLTSKLDNVLVKLNLKNRERQQYATDIAKSSEYEKQLQKYINERDTLIRELAVSEQVIGKVNQNIELNDDDYSSIRVCYNSITEHTNKMLIEKQLVFSKDEDLIKQNLDSFKSQKSKVDNEKDMRKEQINKLQKEISRIDAALGDDSSSADYLSSLEEEIAKLKLQIEQCESEKSLIDTDNMDNLERQKILLKDKVKELKNLIKIANESNDEKVKFENLKAEYEEKHLRVNDIFAKSQDVFNTFEKKDRLYKQLSDKISKSNLDLDQICRCLMSYEKELSTKKTLLNSKIEFVQNKLREIEEIKEKFKGICQIDQYENMVAETATKLSKLRDEKSNMENLKPVIEKQMSMIQSEKTCPLCEHDLSLSWISHKTGQQMDVDSLQKHLETFKDNTSLLEINSTIHDTESFYNKLLLLRSDANFIQTIADKQVSQANQEVDDLKSKVASLQEKVDNEQQRLNSVKAKLETFRACLQGAGDYDNLTEELKKLEQKMAQIDASKFNNQLNVEQLESGLKAKELEFSQCEDNLSSMQKERIRLTDQMIRYQNLAQDAERKKSEYVKREQQKLIDQEKKKEFMLELEQLKIKLTELESLSIQFDPKIKQKEQKLELLTQEFSKFEKETNQKIYDWKNSFKAFDKLVEEITYYSKELQICKEKASSQYIEVLERNIEELEKEKENLTDQISSISRELVNLELKRRELLDCQTLFNLRDSILEQEAELKESERKMGHLDLSSLKRNRISAEREAQSMVTQIQNSKERISDLDDRVQAIIRELQKEDYSNADENYRSKRLQKTISELACEDYDKYYKALDYAVTTFHQNKIEEINRLVEKFWKMSYQGNDIEFVKIVADEEERSASAARRSYNYRVVMVKQGKELDMKGRCSAGQKVLASLIIRMVLSIFFCDNFTLLTLDEPTTNLDRANIHAFSKAILTLIKLNPDFQIVIITHDEEFLQSLGSESALEYYKVSKNHKGYSIISQQSWLQNDTLIPPPSTSGSSTDPTLSVADNEDKKPERKRIKLDKSEKSKSFFDMEHFDEPFDD